MTDEEFQREYAALLRIVQTGLAYEMEIERSTLGTPYHTLMDASVGIGRAAKHLRTGLNGVMRDHASLVRLLVAKGVITDEEYKESVLAGLREEKAAYEQRLTAHYGRKITLG